jgi:hypothetical protein
MTASCLTDIHARFRSSEAKKIVSGFAMKASCVGAKLLGVGNETEGHERGVPDGRCVVYRNDRAGCGC